MIDRQLLQRLETVARRVRSARIWTTLAVVWLVAAFAGGALWYAGYRGFWHATWSMPVLAGGAVLAALVCGWMAWRSARDYRWLARKIEATWPELDSILLTAIEQQPSLPDGHYGYLQRELLHKAYSHSYQHNKWRDLVPNWQIATGHVMHAAGLLLLVAVLFGLATLKPPTPVTPLGVAFGDVEVDQNPAFAITVEPGNTEVERGASLLILARFQGTLPPDATLVYGAEDGDQRRVAMSKSLDDPMFGGRIAAVDAPLTYRVEFAEQASDTYQVTTFEYPQLIQADARLTFPSYTNLPEKVVQDVRRLSAVEGTELTLTCRLNKAVADARLVDGEGEAIELTASVEQANVYEARLKFDRSRRFTLQLTDEDGRANQSPPEFVINVLPNRPPDLKLVQPTRDMQVSPIEELDVKASAWDDYGLTRVGLSFAMAGAGAKDIVLGESLSANQRVPLEHLLAFEEMKAEPDQLLSYYFWAEDVGPGGQVRRTSSDMYFAEVRHFEEIFRQGQQPTDGQMQQQQQQGQQSGQNAQQAEELAELQKQIISGTWKVIRRETRDQPSAEFPTDVALLLESQQSALEQAAELAGQIEDEESREHVDAVQQHMQAAAETLQAAGDGPDIALLAPALLEEQSAYQALLRLRAREHEVVRANQQQSSQGQSAQSSANSRAQQQLQNLELREDENRYETEQTARLDDSQQSQEQREDRQVLNHLRELAQRQSDLNERIKELQSVLEEAESAQEQEEVERQLKRLRDEQEQILRDTEQLQQRMEQPENQERMTQERQQLEQARENARQSSEALQEGQVSQAAAEGTRAERELRDLQNEFQRRTANQFSESMREMQQQARELEETQQELSERLSELTDDGQPSNSLRDDDDREQVAEALGQQEERVENLLNRMRQTVEEAEADEPLLAEQLYDTIRETRQQNPREDLETARQSLQRGFVDDAQQREQQAREGITQLREGIDRAAESILGDDTEALRRARDELDRLGEELNDEIARASPRGEPNDEGQHREGDPREGKPPRRDGQPNGQSQDEGRPRDGSGQPPQQGEQQQGQSPEGQQPGGGQRGQQQRGGDDRIAMPGGGGLQRFLQRGEQPIAPIYGKDFLDWSDRLRDVEEMISDPELRAEAARIRQQAKEIRKDVKRQSEPPNWEVVRKMVAEPLAKLEKRVAEELLRRTSKDALVPIDRDPVPPKYEEQVRRYYERLGSGESRSRD